MHETPRDLAERLGVPDSATGRTCRQIGRQLLKEALYGDRAYHRRTLKGVVAALAGAEPGETATALERALAAWDRRTVARFEAALSAPAE